MNLAESFEHLILPLLSEDFSRKKRKGRGYTKTDRDEKQFYKAEIQALENTSKKFVTQKERFKEYLDPNLIFKINVNQGVHENSFRTELRRAGIEVISPSPDKTGYWVVFAEDEELSIFKAKLEKHIQNGKYDFFYAVEEISDIPPEEKIGERLKEEPFQDDEFSYLDVEIWRMKDSKLVNFISGLDKLINEKNGKIADILKTKNFCLLRIKTNKLIIAEILELREVAHVDRPPKIRIETALNSDIGDFKIGENPPDGAAGILLVDSGILSSHPLLSNAVGDEIALPTINSSQITEDKPYDDIGHGTQVAGIALYGDVEECIKNQAFKPELWIFSAKVMFKDENDFPTYNEEELLEHQLDKAVRYFVENYHNCKIINLSMGNSAKKMFNNKRQFNLASLVDELSKEFNIIFVISSGNIDDYDFKFSDNYPEYLLDESTDNFKIIDPATSALALTVGALSNHNINKFFKVLAEHPSPLTRVGPGYRGMIKPEIVEIGGGFGEELDVITINPNWIQDGRLFTIVKGTSFSAPRISNYIAKLINKYPDRSLNLIKALLLSSASIPSEKPAPLSKMSMGKGGDNAKNLLNIYGYGKPNLNSAFYSESNRVILLRENTIKLDKMHIYPVYLPEDFIEKQGNRSISVTLVFDPPVNKNRVEYLGVTFETHIFKNIGIEEVLKLYKSESIDTEKEEIIPQKIRQNEIKLSPGVTLRKKGVHHKGIIEFKKQPKIDTNQPLVLVVICQNKWIQDEEYNQDYAVIVSIEHSERIDLYNQIRMRNKERVTISLGA